jgi:anti-anti-sigma regulatory factor/pSer/pThr/pTyr-binding forkhead associated (FHA) protein
MKVYLIVAKGKKQGLPIPVDFDLFIIGAGPMCQLRAVHDSIGEQHCALIRRDRKIFICDLDSGGVTFVNGEEVPPGEEWPLHAGDRLDVGPLHFMLQFHERALSKRDLEEWAINCLDQDNGRRITAMDRLETLISTGHAVDDAASTASTILDHLSAKSGVVVGRLRISRESGITIVRLNDVFLVEVAELALIRKELQENLNRPNLKILLDMKSVRRLSTSAAEMFGDLQRWLRPYGSKLAMCRLRGEMREVLETFPTTQNIRFFDEKPAALSASW